MHIQDILTELGKHMGLPNLKLDANRMCRLIFDKVLVIDIEASEDEHTVYIYSKVGEVPPEDKEIFMALLLEANLFGKGTGGAAFGLDHTHQTVYLGRILSINSTDYQEFVNILEEFINYTEAWKKKIEKGDMGQQSLSVVSQDDLGDTSYLRA